VVKNTLSINNKVQIKYYICGCVFIYFTGSGVTGLSHLDGTDVKRGVQRMMEKLKQLGRGGPEGR